MSVAVGVDGCVLQFVSITGSDDSSALFFLESCGFDVEAAVSSFFSQQAEGEGQEREDAHLSSSSSTLGPTAPRARPASTLSTAATGPRLRSRRGEAWLDGRAGEGEDHGRVKAKASTASSPSSLKRRRSTAVGDGDADGVVQPPRPATVERLISGGLWFSSSSSSPSAQLGEVNVEPFRDFRAEFAAATGAAAGERLPRAAEAAFHFSPPTNLLFFGSFEQALRVAEQQSRWLLLNVQDLSAFQCCVLNRDVWCSAALRALLSSSFLLQQLMVNGEEGQRYRTFYNVRSLPHIAIIDPRTRQRLWSWEPSDSNPLHLPRADKLARRLTIFLASHSLLHHQPQSQQRPSVGPHLAAQHLLKPLHRLNDEERLQRAMAESAAEAEEEEQLDGERRGQERSGAVEDDDDVVEVREDEEADEEDGVDVLVISDDDEGAAQLQPSRGGRTARNDDEEEEEEDSLTCAASPPTGIRLEDEKLEQEEEVLEPWTTAAPTSRAHSQPTPVKEQPQPSRAGAPAPALLDGSAAIGSSPASPAPPSAASGVSGHSAVRAAVVPLPSPEPAAGVGVTRLQLRFPSGAVLQRRFRLQDDAAQLLAVIRQQWREQESRTPAKAGQQRVSGSDAAAFRVLCLHPRLSIDLLQHSADSIAALQLSNASLLVQPPHEDDDDDEQP